MSRAVAAKFKFQIPDFVKYLLIAGLIVALIVAVVLWFNQGARVRLDAQILKTRVIPTDENTTLAVLEVRISNPSDVLFVIREAHLNVLLRDGTELEGAPVTQDDLDRFLDYFKTYGGRYNPVLRTKERFHAGSLTDRTIAASFPRPASVIEKRRGFVLELIDVDGAVTRIDQAEAAGK
ncbi:MAG: hypothetical protein ACLQBJ_07075 [Bryobacteraceae bacterium]